MRLYDSSGREVDLSRLVQNIRAYAKLYYGTIAGLCVEVTAVDHWITRWSMKKECYWRGSKDVCIVVWSESRPMLGTVRAEASFVDAALDAVERELSRRVEVVELVRRAESAKEARATRG